MIRRYYATEVQTVETEVEVPVYTLTMTEREAQFLRDICWVISGPPQDEESTRDTDRYPTFSRRAISDRWSKALSKLGVRPSGLDLYSGGRAPDLDGELSFIAYPNPNYTG